MQRGPAGYSIQFVSDPAGNVVALMLQQPNGLWVGSRIAADAPATPGRAQAPTGRGAPPVAPVGRGSTPAVTPQPPSQLADSALLSSLAGDYEMHGQLVQVRLRADGVLTIAAPRANPPQPVRELQPLGNLRFAQKGLADNIVEFQRTPSGDIRGLLFGGFFKARVGGPLDTPEGRAPIPAVASQPSTAPATVRNTPPVQTPPAKVATPPQTQAPAVPARPQPPAASATNTTSGAGTAAASASCDALAAHPDDDNKPAGVAGAADEAIVPARAIPICMQAVEATPKNGRLHFQLGRAYWASKKHGDAIDSFLKAEELGYAPAYFYLAEAYDYGLVEGEKADAALATALYGLAADGGFLPAQAMLGYDTGPAVLEFNPAAFARPEWMRALHAGNVASLKKIDNVTMLAYLGGMRNLLTDNPKEYGPTCEARIERNASAALDKKLEAQTLNIFREALTSPGSLDAAFASLQANIAKANAVDAALQDGVDDMYLLVSDYGGCAGAAFEKFYATFQAYVFSE